MRVDKTTQQWIAHYEEALKTFPYGAHEARNDGCAVATFVTHLEKGFASEVDPKLKAQLDKIVLKL